jgi:cell wall-associated NlpC family hydrolase
LLAVIVLALSLLVAPSMGSGTAWAKGGKGSKATGKAHGKKGANETKKKSKSHASSRSHASRHYTVRGNPEVTRRVATDLIAEKLPELAAIVGIQPTEPETTAAVAETSAQSGPVGQIATSKMIAATPKPADGYQDSELDDSEDPDRITAEDEKSLEDLPTDINSFYKEFTRYMASLNGETTVTDNGVDKVVVMETLMDWVGTRYLFGGMGRNGIDCSAFTGMVYRSLNFKLPRTAAMQWEIGTPVNREDLQFGDLVFFHTRAAVYVSHVGMYLGNGMFAHASSRNGVTVSSLDAEYYSTHLIGARRYDLNEAAVATSAGSDAPDLSHN